MNIISPPPFLGTVPKSISCALNHSDSCFVYGPVHCLCAVLYTAVVSGRCVGGEGREQ